MIIAPDATDVSVYFKLVDPAAGTPETGLVIADLDATYVRDRAVAVKNDLTALDAPDAAHADNRAIEVDSANAPGLYRVDFPDAAFAAGVARVQLVINGAAIDPAVIEVELAPWLTPETGATVRAVNESDASLSTYAGGAVASVTGAVGSVTDPVTVGTNNDKTGYALANGAVNANALASDAAAEIADAVWNEALAGHLSGGTTGKALSDSGAAGDPWAAPVRTLTMSAASVAAMVAGSSITVLRGDTWSISLTGIGNISAREKLWFTLKRSFHEEDGNSLVQIEESVGLVRLNSAAGTASDGALLVTDETTGALTITLKPSATSQLQPASLRYDIQMLTTLGVVQTLTEGTLIILADVTRAIA